MKVIEPGWPVDERTGAFTTTRDGGDDPLEAAELPAEPHWLEQVHGSRVVHLADWRPGIQADAAWTDRAGEVVVIKTADCLPILLADRDAGFVAGIHGGWRSLADGIIDKMLAALPSGADLRAWIGPGICAGCYQVGGEVRQAFVEFDPLLAAAFEADGDRWRADLKWIAAHQLRAGGAEVFDCGRCTFEEADTFYSFRREGKTGRMASLIWLKE
ncbi:MULTISPECIES: peptidoglycan editing factor PgeF [unclassified Wenzhouxiangella]|uniref:peptidoglycan editing factor PgeF n=1 Tax=unclassified Wenzhouxiangella TaxID=2613841 RepID=UPI000E32CD9F|nr:MULTISPECIES: peptidoglycan editing factor PgeF [unclassified Wenzhouxiangella]RFF27118.1 peptidoglycan editing factor PgeF [Wenzhouxiangella sp. 15181]RFP69196.1 peptidoglycan editing factor PgeF [Wenzhouxiangella sp. 15190]